jgi:hypothetical protein
LYYRFCCGLHNEIAVAQYCCVVWRAVTPGGTRNTQSPVDRVETRLCAARSNCSLTTFAPQYTCREVRTSCTQRGRHEKSHIYRVNPNRWTNMECARNTWSVQRSQSCRLLDSISGGGGVHNYLPPDIHEVRTTPLHLVKRRTPTEIPLLHNPPGGDRRVGVRGKIPIVSVHSNQPMEPSFESKTGVVVSVHRVS